MFCGCVFLYVVGFMGPREGQLLWSRANLFRLIPFTVGAACVHERARGATGCRAGASVGWAAPTLLLSAAQAMLGQDGGGEGPSMLHPKIEV